MKKIQTNTRLLCDGMKGQNYWSHGSMEYFPKKNIRIKPGHVIYKCFSANLCNSLDDEITLYPDNPFY